MSGEPEKDRKGGPASADLKEEYRDENRYSVSVAGGNTPGDEAHGVPEDSGENAGDNEQVSSSQRLSRAELEEMYRNDPRFSMLFDHEKNEKKKIVRSVKVGGIRLTPKRILILSLFFLVVLLCICGSLYYALRDIGKYRDYARASALYEAGEYEAAKDLFIKVINEDPNKEDAVAAMADIYRHYRDWGNESFFRQRIMRLNPLNEEYFHDFLESAFRARNFGSIYSILNLKVMENPDLPPEEGALYLIAALHSGHVSNGKNFYAERKKANPKYFTESERGRFADLLLNGAEMNKEQMQNHLASLDQIKDPQVRFEMGNVLLYFLSKQHDRESDEKMERLLLEAVELNDYAGAPLLANYYFLHERFDDVIRICDEFLKSRVNASMPVLFGESCVLNGQPELIPPLADRIRRLRGRQSKVIASYLDALTAFNDGDNERLQTAMLESGSTIETPLSSLIKLQMAIHIDSPKDIQLTLGKIMKGGSFMDFQARARTAALQYLTVKAGTDSVNDSDLLTMYAGIAALIETPDDDVSFLRRIILLDHYKRNIMTGDELQAALKTFPGDPVLLKIAAEYSLSRKQPARTMEYISEFNELDGVPEKTRRTMRILHMLALDQLGRKEDAQKEFRLIVEQEKDGFMVYVYFEYCAENGYSDSLKSFGEWLENLPADSSNRMAIPFVRAEILLSEGKKDQALDLFEKSPSDDPFFVFHAASRLAGNGRNDAAFNRYLSIRNTYPDKALVNINLSELYRGKGDADNALACARTAWEENRNDLLSRYIYGKRLFEAGQYQDAVDVLKFPQYMASFPEKMLDLWSRAVRAQIKADFAKERYLSAQDNVKYLLIYFPEDREGLEYAEKIQRIRRHESVGGSGK